MEAVAVEEPAKNLLRNRKAYIITAAAFTAVLVAIGIFIFSPKTTPDQDRPANGRKNNSTKTSAVDSKSAADDPPAENTAQNDIETPVHESFDIDRLKADAAALDDGLQALSDDIAAASELTGATELLELDRDLAELGRE